MDAAANLELMDLLEQTKHEDAINFLEKIPELLSHQLVRTSFKKTTRQRTFWHLKNALRDDEVFAKDWEELFGEGLVTVSCAGEEYIFSSKNYKVTFRNNRPKFTSYLGMDESTPVNQKVKLLKEYIIEGPERYPWITELYNQ